MLTNPLSPRRHIDIFFTLPLPYLATRYRSIRSKIDKNRIGSVDLKIEAAQSFPKKFYRNLSILDRRYQSVLIITDLLQYL